MPRPNSRVNAAYEAYQKTLPPQEEQPPQAEQAPQEEEPVEEIRSRGRYIDRLNQWLVRGPKPLYIADREGRVRSINIGQLFVATTDKNAAFTKSLDGKLDDDEIKKWHNEFSMNPFFTPVLETLFALADQGFRFLRKVSGDEKEEKYGFLHFHREERESGTKLWEQGAGKEDAEATQLVQAERGIKENNGKIPDFEFPELPEKEPEHYAPPLFRSVLKEKKVYPLLDAAFEKAFPDTDNTLQGEQARKELRKNAVITALRNFENTYLVDKGMHEGAVAMEENLFPKVDEPMNEDEEEELQNKRETHLEWLLRQMENGCMVLKPEGDGRFGLYDNRSEGQNLIDLRSLAPAAPEVDEELEKMEEPGWFRRFLSYFISSWQQEVERYDSYKAKKKVYEDGKRAYESDVKTAAEVPKEIADQQAAFTQEERKQLKTLCQMRWDKKMADELWKGTNPIPYQERAKKNTEARTDALQMLNGIKKGDIAPALTALEQGLLLHNLNFRRANLLDPLAEESARYLKKGLRLFLELKGSDEKAYTAWEKGKDKNALTRLLRESHGAVELIGFVKGRGSMDELLKTEEGSDLRKKLLMDVLGTAVMADIMKRRYSRELQQRARLARGNDLTPREEQQICSSNTEQQDFSNGEPGRKKALERWKGIQKTDFFQECAVLSPEALEVTLVGTDGKLRPEVIIDVCKQYEEIHKREKQEKEAAMKQAPKKEKQAEEPALKKEEQAEEPALKK